MQTKLLLLELNEVNFEFVEAYTRRGELPNFAALFQQHGYTRTTSESSYEQLEPWIQWVTAHTGMSLAEHSVFRLGDIAARDIPQIWELLEERGLKVGAISPMNAKHRLRDPAFFVPDPWTRTEISAPPLLRRLYAALAQVVNENASSRLSAASLVGLLGGVMRYARLTNYPRYAQLALSSIGRSWRRALFLDLLLADVFVNEVLRTRPHFASLFVNAAAHVQHHYMYSAAPYEGPHRNPRWYIAAGVDPVLESYRLYDTIIGQLRRAVPARLMLATGLHQVPHAERTFYWRLREHATFLRSIDVPFVRVEPRMSRDFLIACEDAQMAGRAGERLAQARSPDGTALFEVDNRGTDLFVMLTYPREITADFRFRIGQREYAGLRDQVVFVALKNGAHDGVGYFLDTGCPRQALPAEFPLKQMPERIMQALGLPGGAAAGLQSQ
jgi:hypothetical protein